MFVLSLRQADISAASGIIRTRKKPEAVAADVQRDSQHKQESHVWLT